jgi:hypothetical protein
LAFSFENITFAIRNQQYFYRMKCWQQRLDDLKSSTVMLAFIDCDTMAVEQRLNNNRNNINNNRTIRKPDKDEKVFDALCIPDNGSFFDGSRR